ILCEKLKTIDVVTFKEKDEVFSSETYKNVNSDSMMELSDLITADDYKFVKVKDEDFSTKLYNEIGVKGSIFANFKFQKMMMGGVAKNGKMGAVVILNIIIVDQNGEIVFNKSYYGQSSETVGIVAGVYDIDQFVELFEPVIEGICDKFVSEF
ncbi:MAG: hypothetical protein PQJ46_12275, partial [Spirochaetales bacterium]|nr:hypothetical protein [Spirochaetales bacterium]